MHNTFFRLPLIIVILTVLVTLAISSLAFAQAEGVSVDTFTPSASPNALFQLDLPKTKRHLKWTVGGLVHYGFRTVRRTVTDPAGDVLVEDYPVQMRLQADLSFAIGLFDWLELGVGIPVIVYQRAQGDGLSLQPAGIGDPRIQAKASIIQKGGFEGGAGLEVTFPVGHYASGGDDYMGTTAPTAHPALLASYTLANILIFGANAGVLIRPTAELPSYDQKTAFTWSVGAAWDIREFEEFGGIRLAVENNGQMAFGMDSVAQLPMEVLAGVKYRTSKDIVLAGGGGIGLTDAVGMPLFRVFVGAYYDQVLHNCPAGPEDMDGFQDDDKCVDPDNDMDGFLDEVDDCPNQAEDMDEFNDEDGCPDKDNDGDGIPDVVDTCPMLPEDRDGYEDDDGCPEEGPGKATVKITDTQLLLSSKVYFDYNKDVIKEVSYPILDAVGDALRNNPHIEHIRVEGHSDNEGTEQYNLDLSERRAKAVVDYLIGKSIDEERLSYKGYGFSVPKASNDTEEGRAINRRVEFRIVSKDSSHEDN